jgi:hypothetical protein
MCTNLNELLLRLFTPDIFGVRDALADVLLTFACDSRYNCSALLLWHVLPLLMQGPVSSLAEAACDTYSQQENALRTIK